jgi:hypothetical protein
LDDEPNAPNVKHTLVRATRLHPPVLIRGINLNYFRERPIISIGHASPAAEAASLAGAAETARMADGFVKWGLSELYNLETRRQNEMQRRMQDQHGCTEFKGCNDGEFDLCVFENPHTGIVRAFKRPFIPIGAENPFLVASRELMLASHALDIARSRILHPGALQQHSLMSRAMRSAMSANPDLTERSGLASILAGRLTDPMSATMRPSAYDQLKPSILKRQGGKKRTGRARLRLRSRFQSRRRR